MTKQFVGATEIEYAEYLDGVFGPEYKGDEVKCEERGIINTSYPSLRTLRNRAVTGGLNFKGCLFKKNPEVIQNQKYKTASCFSYDKILAEGLEVYNPEN